MKSSWNPPDRQTTLIVLVLAWITWVHARSILIWFDWETVRFFIQPRPGQFRWITPWADSWIDLSDYGIRVASQTLRPLMTWLFQCEVLVFGEAVSGYHVVNLLGHLTATTLLIRFLRHIGTALPTAALTGLLFGVHPLATQPLWILGDRAEIAVLIGGLLALIHYAHRPVIAGGALLFALYSKETAVTIPLWMAAYDGVFIDRGVPFLRTLRFRIRRLAVPAVLTAGYLVHRFIAFKGIGGYQSVDHGHIHHVIDVVTQNIAWLLTVPQGHPILLTVLVPTVAAAFVSGQRRICRFGIIWSILFFIPIHNLCNKWYLYTPLAAAAVIIAGAVDASIRSPYRWRIATAMMLTTAIGLSLMSTAELNHQRGNAAVAPDLAQRLETQIKPLPADARIDFVLPSPLTADSLAGHYFVPNRTPLKKVKSPLESIVWDLNSTRYLNRQPVWNRSVEAAIRLRYNDITIRADLVESDAVPEQSVTHMRIAYNPLTRELTWQD
ncbi:hypothetical protein JXA80_00275 [bacterium]|nr:hypothetical protein [candidate division CSSED10-310 bacterium]